LKQLFKFFALILLASGAVFAWYWNEYNSFLQRPVNNQKSVTFVIKSGSNLTQIANQLKLQNIISKPVYFKIYTKLAGKSSQLQAGEYIIKADYTIETIWAIGVGSIVGHLST